MVDSLCFAYSRRFCHWISSSFSISNIKKSHSQSFDLYLIFTFLFLSFLWYWSLSLSTLSIGHTQFRSTEGTKKYTPSWWNANIYYVCVFHSRSEYIMCDIWAGIWRRTSHTKYRQLKLVSSSWYRGDGGVTSAAKSNFKHTQSEK